MLADFYQFAFDHSFLIVAVLLIALVIYLYVSGRTKRYFGGMDEILMREIGMSRDVTTRNLLDN